MKAMFRLGSFCWSMILALAVSQAAHFPAGIDPRLCPNYPQCDNAILAAFSKNPLPFMRGGSGSGRNNGGARDIEINHFLFTPPGYPVGLTRDQCPNYPFCH
ncbi:cuticle protein 1-like [Cimex lectularius]|uniref:Cuticle protein CPCFC domain-containing protein n=1 Tax=Cimex lectularius TaxID=79782 RepID=A0A8I6SDQ8_CIMLE|nr:cuticle protein 1-like [Cimex lectularius]